MNDKTEPLKILDDLATTVCVDEADAYKRREQTTRSQAICYGDGVRMGFVVGYITRHYLRPEDRSIGIEVDDLLETIKDRHPAAFAKLEALLEGPADEDEDTMLDESEAALFDEAPPEHNEP